MPLVQSFMVHKLTLMPNHKLFADWSPTVKLLQGSSSHMTSYTS